MPNPMMLRCELALEDVLAFNRYHYRHSPAIRRMSLLVVVVFALLCAIAIPALLMVGIWMACPRLVIPSLWLLALGLLTGALLGFAMYSRLPGARDRQVLRLYEQAENRALLGPQEFSIDATGLTKRTRLSESHQTWRAVSKIVETESHAFLYLTSWQAHIISKQRSSEGDPVQFIAQARQWWSAAHEVYDAEIAD